MLEAIKRPAGIVALPLLLAGLGGAVAPATGAMAVARSAGPAPSSLTVSGSLRAVAATSARNAWAVGATGSGRPLILHWNGSVWAKVANPGFTGRGSLSGVAAVSASDAWAVGSASNGKALILLHWNGSTWAKGFTGSGGLSAVAAVSARDAWAVGSASNGRTLILHWNGSSWKQAPGSVRGNLSAVAATSAHSGWAVGGRTTGTGINIQFRTLIMAWNGTSWRRVTSPRTKAHVTSFLNGVTAPSSRSAWVVGDGTDCGCGPGLSLTWRWNGISWKRVPSPSPGGGTTLLGVAAIPGHSSFWAAGISGEGDSLTKTVILRWNGTAWQRVPSPAPRASSELSGVTAVSAGLAWAVGSASSKSRSGSTTVILRWDGKAWR
jgi:hypothetical protein